MVAVPAGLGLAAAMVLAAGPPSQNPLTQGTQAGAAPAPGADEALPPAPDDFFDDGQSGGAPQGGQSGQETAPEDPGDAGTGEPAPDAVIEGGATVAPSQQPDGEQDGSGSGDGSQGEGSGGGSGSDSSGGGGSQPSTLAQQVVSIANEERADAGCGPLQVDPRLTAASEGHSQDMSERDYMAHENPDGEGPAERAEEAGYGSWSGENVAAGYTSAASVMEGWMNSPGHRANILNCDNTEVGVGETDTRWAQNFGTG
ncbi:CAP domain-containing protein [Streptomonospora wellingtoniae]|uniref:CAP domain-containing protein n=1 Tax=Streptomonospora wellingtoniae TaxID=3075544 RepID=A0ABU2KS98_9ACTN|nr:CAP domain-containing protein [Streptomonospora sp. DSM 45055]MDT0302096.1 CAP domain-containing protein [Streptomonospora sp. DSM 45055]